MLHCFEYCTHNSKECKSASNCCGDCINCIPLLLINITSNNKYTAEPELYQTKIFHLLPALTHHFLMNMVLIVLELVHTEALLRVFGGLERAIYYAF